MKRIVFLAIFFIIFLLSCNMYVNDKIGILLFNEDANGNEITNDMIPFLLIKRYDTSSLNNLTYITGSVKNKKGIQFINNIDEAKYIKDINDTNSIIDIDLSSNEMSINYSEEEIVFTDDDGKKYVLPLNNSEDTWFYKLIKGNNTNL